VCHPITTTLSGTGWLDCGLDGWMAGRHILDARRLNNQNLFSPRNKKDQKQKQVTIFQNTEYVYRRTKNI
jgi:hypothetical protein